MEQNSNNSGRPSDSNMFPRRSGSSSIVIFLVVIIAYIFISRMYSDSDISWSSAERTKMDNAPAPTEFYTDESGSYITDEAALEEGVYSFYSQTGVPPYIYILADDSTVQSSEDLSDTAEELYSELFTDEEHFLIVAVNNGEGFIFAYAIGDEAKTVIDDTETLTIFGECINTYFNSSDISASLSTALDTAASHIMKTGNSTLRIVIVVLLVVIAIGYIVMRYKKNGGSWNTDNPDSSNDRFSFRR